MRFNFLSCVVALFVVVACKLSGTALAQDVRYYEIVREEFFTQSATNRADTAHAMAHELCAYVMPTSEGSVLSAALASPTRQKYSMTNYNGEFCLVDQAGKTVQFAGAAPAGIYQFQVHCANEGVQTVKLAMPGPATGIPPMRVSNFPELQSVDASQPFDVRWDKVSRRGSSDYLRLVIYDSKGNELFYQSRIGLEQTNLSIPAGTLQPNTINNAYLTTFHYFGSLTSKLPQRIMVEGRETRFHIATANPSGVFEFSPVCVVANEEAGTATMTVHRTQGSAGEATVDYFSTDGTAQANVNYVPVSGTLVFADGETNQTFTIPLLNDGVTNTPLTVRLSLTNATGGAALAVQPHAVLTILDSQSAPGTNVNACLLSKVEYFDQTNTNKPVQSARSLTSRFFASVHSKFPGGVTEASLKLPNQSTCALDRIFQDYEAFFDRSEDFPSPAAMNSRFRAGKYVLSFDTLTDGSFSQSFVLGVERSFSAPYLTNWAEAQAIEPSQPFTLKWAPFAGGATNDFVLVSLRDEAQEFVVRTSDEFEPGALPGTTRSFTIPANTLEPGHRYYVNIIFVKTVGAARNPRTSIRSGIAYMRTTGLYVSTVPASSADARDR